jgi:hypothetical protein
MTPQASSSSFATGEHEQFIVCLSVFDVFMRAVAAQLHTIGDEQDLLQSSPLSGTIIAHLHEPEL